jgi:hypothetical protein
VFTTGLPKGAFSKAFIYVRDEAEELESSVKQRCVGGGDSDIIAVNHTLVTTTSSYKREKHKSF